MKSRPGADVAAAPLAVGQRVFGTRRGLRRPRQAAVERAGRRHQRRRLLPGRRGLAGAAAHGRGGRRYRPGSWRRRRAEPAVRARHRRAHGAHPIEAAGGSTSHVARRLGLRPRAGGRRAAHALRRVRGSRGAARARDDRRLPARLHSHEAAIVGRDARRRHPWRVAPLIGWAAARERVPRRVVALRDRLPLADASLHGDRVAVPRRLRERRVPSASRRRPGRMPNRRQAVAFSAACCPSASFRRWSASPARGTPGSRSFWAWA